MSEETNNIWNTKSGSFVKRPGKGWLHSDEKMQQEGAIYTVKYVGSLAVNESMKSLSFETRTLVARESIRRVAESARAISFPRRNKKPDDNLNRILNSKPDLQNSGTLIGLHINIQYLKATPLDNEQILFQHMMQNISFACGGDTDIQNYVAYVAKDDFKGRSCYVFECDNGLANNVITTIGQAFELRFKKYLNSIPNNKNILQGTPQIHNMHDTQNLMNSNTKENITNNISPTAEAPLKKFNLTEQTQNTQNHQPHHQNRHNQPINGNNHMNTVESPTTATATTPTSSRLDENLSNMSWFHGLLTRESAEQLLKNDGDYLVRTSNKIAEKQYVLSGRYKGDCRHIFLVDPSGVVRTKDRVFDNVCHLIKYHQDNNIPIVSKDNELLLENPISRFT